MWPFKKNIKKETKTQETKLEEFPELPPLPESPELPPLPGLSEFRQEYKAKDEQALKIQPAILPQFPQIKNERTITKPSLPPLTRETEPEIIQMNFPRRTREIGEKIRTREVIPTKTREIRETREITPEIKTEPVFVRIDKYQQALKKFQEIKSRLLEIENILRNIKETRDREETQLEQWETEIQEAKYK